MNKVEIVTTDYVESDLVWEAEQVRFLGRRTAHRSVAVPPRLATCCR